jgi:uncharacterized protein (TIGR03086 family)
VTAEHARDTYPPEHHFLRDLDVTTEQVTAERSISLAPVEDSVRNAAGAASLGFLAALVDTNAALIALIAGQPDWTATADLGFHATGWLTEGPALVEGRLERAGSNIVVVGTQLFDGNGLEDLDAFVRRDGAEPTRVARGLVTFARIPARASVSAGRFDGAAVIGQRRRLAPSEPPEPVPLTERIGLDVVDAASGVVELRRSDYVRNSFGTINGGVLGVLFQAAAESAVPGLVGTDLQIHYLAQATVGPARTSVDVLRHAGDHAVCGVHAVDAGNDDRVLALATVTLQRPPEAAAWSTARPGTTGAVRGGDVMEPDLLDAYARASEWTNGKVKGAVTSMDARTPCDEWDVQTLLNHMLDTQRYFVGAARGEDVSPPSPNPPTLLGDDPVAEFENAREETLRTFGEPGVIEKTGPSLGIAFSDHLLHGWDVAKATGQDTTMPDGLAAVAYEMIHGRFTDEQRKGVFKPEVAVGPDATPQEKLLAYTGRSPA